MRTGGLVMFALVAVCSGFVASSAHAQVQSAIVAGIVRGPDGEPVGGASVTLLDTLGAQLSEVSSATDGSFRLTNVAPGTYSLQASAPPLRAVVHGVAIGGALPVQIELRMSAVAADQVIVRADADVQPGSTTSRVTIAGDAVRRAPVRLRSRGLQDVIATAPGWASEDNGLLHVRGVDDGFLYVVDGVPVYERLDGLFGVAPDPAMLGSVSISTGYIAPEFGLKSGGVIEVRSAERVSESWAATTDLAGGSESTWDLSALAGGPLSPRAALTVGVARQRSDRFLDAVHPDNLHNDGGALSGGAQLGWNVSSRSTLTAVAGFGRSRFDVPHGEEQEEAGQDQRQRLTQHWETVSWQHARSGDTVSQLAGYHRASEAALLGSALDTPLFTSADRTLRRVGMLASVTLNRGSHLFKVGGEAARLNLREDFLFAVTDPEEAKEADLTEAVMAFTPDAPFLFRDRAAPTLVSFYIQDSVRPAGRLTLDIGLRADWTRLLTSASQWSPRLGAAYHWPRSQTTLRGSIGRFFQPPQPENILLASSPQARRLSPFSDATGGGGAELEPERQTALEAAVEQVIVRALRLDVAFWHRRVSEAADPNVFFGTTIIFPNTVAEGRASGLDVRLDLPRRGGWSGYVSYTNSHVRQRGPITGGLFLEDDIVSIGAGEWFTPDHDQRHVGAFSLTYDTAEAGFWVSVSGRYESGTPLEFEEEDLDQLLDRAGADLVDFARGRVRPRNVYDASVARRLLRTDRADVTARLAVLNLTGTRWAYNFGNPFSGTHFGHGRTFQVGVRVALR